MFLGRVLNGSIWVGGLFLLTITGQAGARHTKQKVTDESLALSNEQKISEIKKITRSTSTGRMLYDQAKRVGLRHIGLERGLSGGAYSNMDNAHICLDQDIYWLRFSLQGELLFQVLQRIFWKNFYRPY